MKGLDNYDPGKRTENQVLLAVLVACGLVLTPFIILVPISQPGCGCMGVSGEGLFTTISISLHTGTAGSHMTLRHYSGDPMDMSQCRIIIIENFGSESNTVLWDLSGTLNAGEELYLNEVNAPGFEGLEYVEGEFYTVEIYDLEYQKRVFVDHSVECK